MFLTHLVYLSCLILLVSPFSPKKYELARKSTEEKFTSFLQQNFAEIDEGKLTNILEQYIELLKDIQRDFPMVDSSDDESSNESMDDNSSNESEDEETESNYSDDNDPLLCDTTDMLQLLNEGLKESDPKISGYIYDHVSYILDECGIEDKNIEEVLEMAEKKKTDITNKEINRKLCKILISFIYENRKNFVKNHLFINSLDYMKQAYKVFFGKHWKEDPYAEIFDDI